ncbi:MAG: CoA transferase [Deltaproteobacteria bacterium]|nr:CoA transferase [Deltaproteobacteria bacterium]
MKKALDDIRVVEYAEMMSGPMCGKMLSDMGAEVIKIEPPGCGDRSRHLPPFAGDVPHPEKSGTFLYLNTGKKSLTLDLTKPTGAEIFRNLIRDADIVIENHPPGFLASIGLDYSVLHALNPRLIVASITPFGQLGPYRDWKGSDLIEWSMSLAGYNTPTLVDDEEEENPLRAPGHAAEMMGAANAAAAVMCALFHRDATGEGQWIDAPCWQGTVNTAKIEMAVYSYFGIPFSRLRGKQPAGLEPLPCRDGYVYTLWAADSHFTALKTLLDNPPVLDSELFDTLAGRQANDDALRMLVREQLAKYDMEYLVTEGQKLGLTIGPVYTVAQAANHPHLAARNAFAEITHPIAGTFKYPQHLVSLTATPPVPVRAPMLGEHNAEILDRLGITREEQQTLRATGII